jgi:membrane peptidoglycan carboxypeptidase
MQGKVAPYFVDYVVAKAEEVLGTGIKNQGLRIHTTLDPHLQEVAEKAISTSDDLLYSAEKRLGPDTSEKKLTNGLPVEASALLSDPRTGEILAMVGGRDYGLSQFNRAATAMRSPGSAFKPVVYSLALNSGHRWSDLFYVSPLTVDGTYRPRNPNEDYLTETTMLRAFYRSMNSPTIEIVKQLPFAAIRNHALNLGIESPVKEEVGSALGSSELTMLDLARLYGTFANQGQKTELIPITKIEDRDGKILFQALDVQDRTKTVLSQQQAFLMTQGMRGVLAYGTGYRSGQLSDWAAGKSGTSNDSKDNWFCGYSSDLVTIVWVGSDSNRRIGGGFTGSTLALPIWEKIMKAHESLVQPKPFETPLGVVAQSIHSRYGYPDKDGVTMWFLQSNLPPAHSSALKALDVGRSYRTVFSKD